MPLTLALDAIRHLIFLINFDASGRPHPGDMRRVEKSVEEDLIKRTFTPICVAINFLHFYF